MNIKIKKILVVLVLVAHNHFGSLAANAKTVITQTTEITQKPPIRIVCR
jgi:hypothetical protein